MTSGPLEAKALDSLEPQIGFLIYDDFYYGPDRHPEVSERSMVLKLDPPAIPREFPSVARSFEVLGHEQALADYYWRIVAAARSRGKDFNQIRSYFWMRLWLSQPKDGLSISFPWYDSLSEMRRFSDAIASQSVGDLYWDADQGWGLDVKGTHDRLLIHEHDPDDGGEGLLVSVPRAEFQRRMSAVMQDAEAIVARLAHESGVDVWTAYVRDEPRFTRRGS